MRPLILMSMLAAVLIGPGFGQLRAQMSPAEAMKLLRQQEQARQAEADSPADANVNLDLHRRGPDGRWRWTDADREEIEALEQRIRRDADGFYEVQTYTWVVRSDTNARFTAELAHFMQLFAEAFPRIFPAPADNRVAVKPTLVVFADEADFQEIGGAGAGLFKYAFRGKRVEDFTLYAFASDGAAQAFADYPHATLQHEGTHALLQWRLGAVAVPTWFHEAHATYFEPWDLGRPMRMNEQGLRDRRSGRMRHLRWQIFRQGKAPTDLLPTVAELVELDTYEKFSRSGDDDQIALNYTAAELFMRFLLAEESRFNHYTLMFQRARDKRYEQLITPAELRVLEEKWRTYLERELKSSLRLPDRGESE